MSEEAETAAQIVIPQTISAARKKKQQPKNQEQLAAEAQAELRTHAH